MDDYQSYKYYKSKYKQLQQLNGGGRKNHHKSVRHRRHPPKRHREETRFGYQTNTYNPYYQQAKNNKLHADSIAKKVKGEVEPMKKDILKMAQGIKGELQEVAHLVSWVNHFDAIQDLHSGKGNQDYGEKVNKELLNDEKLWGKLQDELRHAKPEHLKQIRSKKYGKNILHALLMSDNTPALNYAYGQQPQTMNYLVQQPTRNELGKTKNRPFQSKAMALKFSKEEGAKERKQVAEQADKEGNVKPYLDHHTGGSIGFWSWLGF